MPLSWAQWTSSEAQSSSLSLTHLLDVIYTLADARTIQPAAAQSSCGSSTEQHNVLVYIIPLARIILILTAFFQAVSWSRMRVNLQLRTLHVFNMRLGSRPSSFAASSVGKILSTPRAPYSW